MSECVCEDCGGCVCVCACGLRRVCVTACGVCVSVCVCGGCVRCDF